jgi:hypothetical protein
MVTQCCKESDSRRAGTNRTEEAGRSGSATSHPRHAAAIQVAECKFCDQAVTHEVGCSLSAPSRKARMGAPRLRGTGRRVALALTAAGRDALSLLGRRSPCIHYDC